MHKVLYNISIYLGTEQFLVNSVELSHFCQQVLMYNMAWNVGHESDHVTLNPLMAIGNNSCQFNICCPRDCVSRHNGGTSVPPLNPSESIVF